MSRVACAPSLLIILADSAGLIDKAFEIYQDSFGSYVCHFRRTWFVGVRVLLPVYGTICNNRPVMLLVTTVAFGPLRYLRRPIPRSYDS